ncbi:MarR family winged helix-turn-helix transcriptional regulator [Paenibacillus soyae]|uniref:MarR family transcriptional regulator n=1 Tax=Paenibacillus soyae TaxID=2969249 RepID=A0A9X2MQX1_9BACL|nr:MarR family transcriptional regulator [Paenibacillus soyae]MCR2805209.1 MarR family transcriptional regulator [Paenibacillus soyae]
MSDKANDSNENENERITELMDVFTRFAKADWRKSAKWGIRASEARVLFAIQNNSRMTGKPTTVTELSKYLQVTSPTVTQLVNALIAGGYVIRAIHPEDRRISEITLTDKGESLARQAADEYRRMFSGLIEHLGEEQSEQLVALLTQAFDYFQGLK